MPYQLEPAYIEQMPEQGRPFDQAPIRQEPPLLDEGNHLSYSIQWFTFALVLGFGYIMLVRQQTRKGARMNPVPVVRADAPMAETPVPEAIAAVAPGQPSAGERSHDEAEPSWQANPLRQFNGNQFLCLRVRPYRNRKVLPPKFH